MLGLSSRAPLPVTKSGTARKFDALASFLCALFARALLDLELFASPRSSRLAAMPLLCPALSTQILPKMAPRSPCSKPWGTHLPPGGRRRRGWGLNFNGDWLPLPQPHFPGARQAEGIQRAAPALRASALGKKRPLLPQKWRQHLPPASPN